MGVQATGREVALKGINIFRVRDGKITERWGQGSTTSSNDQNLWMALGGVT
jgi:predicted ester cyclase